MIFVVESYDDQSDDWEVIGRVILPFEASRHAVEHALASLGIYAPRGNDTLDWGDFGVIYNYADEAMVRLMPEH